MLLSKELIAQFAKTTNDSKESTNSNMRYGTVVKSNGVLKLKMDGTGDFDDPATVLTPIGKQVVGIKEGDRVSFEIVNHQVVVTGNLTNNAVSSSQYDPSFIERLGTNVDTLNQEVSELMKFPITSLPIVGPSDNMKTMGANQIIDLSDNTIMSKCKNGLVFVWKPNDGELEYHFVEKHVIHYSEAGIVMANPYLGMYKRVKISDTAITGTEINDGYGSFNGINYNNSSIVLFALYYV